MSSVDAEAVRTSCNRPGTVIGAYAAALEWFGVTSASPRSVNPVPPSLEEVVYDLARGALDEQRDVVASLRSRAAPVLAGAGALAALLARPAVGDGLSFADEPLHATLVCAGIAGAVLAIVGAILVLATRDFGFSVDADELYKAAYADREHPEIYLLRLAESHRERRVANRDGVKALQRFLVGGLVGVLVEVAGFAAALVVE
jgi:hypothetical protein